MKSDFVPISAYEKVLWDLNKLRGAVYNIYYAAHWTPDREVDSEKLWEELRDTAGFAKSKSPKPIGDN